MKRSATIFVFSSLLLAPCAAFAQVERPEPAAVSELREARRAQAIPTRLVAPIARVAPETLLDLYVVTRGGYDVPFTLIYLARDGKATELGRHVIPAERHLRLDLAILADSGAFLGAVELRFSGDPELVQGWLIYSSQGQHHEISLRVPEAQLSRRFTSFWPQVRGTRPRYYVTNTTDYSASFTTRWTAADRTTPQLITLPPRGSAVLEPPQSIGGGAGSLEVNVHDAVGVVIGNGLLESPKGPVATLPWLTPSTLESATDYYSLQAHAADVIALAIFNPRSRETIVTVELLEERTGIAVGRTAFALKPEAIRLLSTENRPFSVTQTERNVRLRVRSAEAVIPVAFARSLSGHFHEISLFQTAEAHQSGTYPLPSLLDFDVETTLINLDPALEARIAGQVSWDGGTFTFGPIEIPPGASHVLNYLAIATARTHDILGRILPPHATAGFVQWLALEGSDQIIARTEARPLGTADDAFGFNCFGCCWEFPTGVVVPQTVAFGPGENPLFQTCVEYATCAGTVGPIPVTANSLIYSSPFSWNGTRISASHGGDATVGFVDDVPQITPTCVQRTRTIEAGGRAETCDKFCNPQGYTDETNCSTQVGASCLLCYNCCDDLYWKDVCSGASLESRIPGYNLCVNICFADRSDSCGPIPPAPRITGCIPN